MLIFGRYHMVCIFEAQECTIKIEERFSWGHYWGFAVLKPVCCKKWQKKVPTKKLVWGIGDIWGYEWYQISMSDPINHLGSIWCHSEPLEVPYSPNQFLGWVFFCRFLQQTGSSRSQWVELFFKIALNC